MTVLAPIAAASTRAGSTGFVPRRLENLIAGHLLRPYFLRDRETLLMAGFDSFDRLVRMEIVHGDGDHCSPVPPRCWRAAAQRGIAYVVIAHNHPSNIAQPSAADRVCTGKAARILATLGVELSDHLIFTARGHYSFQRARLL